MSHLPIGGFLQNEKYCIRRFIGSGGFGCTYEAEHVMLEKRVAIKEFFVRDFCNRDEATAHVTVGTESKRALVDKLRRKFIDEAKNLCRLRHPGIVSVSDVFEENGTAYFVMDYIEGESLAELVQHEGALAEAYALDLIRRAADALQYVHAHNRLHLDLKPGNIMIDRSGEVVLIDFGASKQYDEQGGENTSTLLGKTPGYAPLEQMGNDVVQFLPATDIYALGATLYKLLTGQTPPSATLLASGEELDALPSTISPTTQRAVEVAMCLNKRRRPQSVAEFLSLLDAEKVAPQQNTSPFQVRELTIMDDPSVKIGEVNLDEDTIYESSVSSPKRYRVGDFYNDGLKQGVVFEVDNSGQHGKIVSMNQSELLAWTIRERQQAMATDRVNGANNMNKVRIYSNWKRDYSAFAWCAEQGQTWYLPAIDELRCFLLNETVRDTISRTLIVHGGVGLDNQGLVYWSSTEYDDNQAWCIDMLDGYVGPEKKYFGYVARAIAAF